MGINVEPRKKAKDTKPETQLRDFESAKTYQNPTEYCKCGRKLENKAQRAWKQCAFCAG